MPAETGKKSEGALSGLFSKEDWLSVWLGFLIIALILLGVTVKLPGFKWTTDGQFSGVVAQMAPMVDSLVKGAGEKNDADVLAAATALNTAMAGQDRKAVGDAAKKLAEVGKKSPDAGLKSKADAVTKELITPAGQLTGNVFSGDNIGRSIYIGLGYLILASIGIALMGASVAKFIVGFPVVYLLAWLSMFIAGNYSVTYWGLEFVLWALVLGLFISNVLGLPEWMKEEVRTEYYIKVRLVVLGTSILFGEILQAEAYGVVQAIIVVGAV